MTGRRSTYAGGTARYWLLGSAVILCAIGLVMIYSASSVVALAKYQSSWHFLARQVIFLVVGWGLALAVGHQDYRRLKGSAITWWSASVVLLITVLVLGFASHGAQRWIPLGLFNLQPSEVAKVACVVLVAALAVDWQRGKITGKLLGWRVLLYTAVPAVLIIIQPDMGTTVTLAVAVIFVLVLAGIDLRWLLGAGATLGAVALIFILRSDYRMARVTGFLNPWADPAKTGYQSIQALYAFGSGGLDGVGLGLSRQKFFYLPEAHTDFILAIIGEEAGLIGTLVVVVAMSVFVWAGFRIAMGARDPFGRLLAGGLSAVLGFQALVNMAAVTGMMPITGKPLPFVSYGGSSMLVTMLAVGIVLSVSEYGMLAPAAVRPKRVSKERAREGSDERRRDGGAHLPRAERSRPARRRA